ncbi:MAG: O-antigen ligase family protein [Planctomycetota bacterium]|nr:O-antigen ligase family protein [Planctomycetota bacterium]
MTREANAREGVTHEATTPRASAGWGALVVVALVLGRAMVTVTPFPGWDTDPGAMALPDLGIGPSASLAWDTLTLVASAFTLWASRAIAPWVVACAAAGLGALGWHVFGRGIALEHLLMASPWAAGLMGALAISAAARDRAVRRVVFASLLTFGVALAVKGAIQVYIEQPMTLRAYRETREAFLAAQGWAPDSPQARSYERRLAGGDATAWFGISNILGTFGALGLVSTATLALAAIRARVRDRSAYAGLALMLGASVAILILTRSKGAAVASALGLGLAMVLYALSSARKGWNARSVRTLWSGAVLAGLVALAPHAAVMVRGLAGEKLSELSLLFRSFYAQGAARIIADHPLLGVGPAGFKDAYLLARPPLSPEEVSSPHSAPLDWLAAMGAPGLGWCALALAALAVALACALRHRDTSHASSPLDPAGAPTPFGGDGRLERNAILLIAVGASAASLWIERAAMVPEAALLRIVGLGAWALAALFIAGLIARLEDLGRGAMSAIALAAGVGTLVAHAQIDLALTNGASVGVAAAWLGLAAAMHTPRAWDDARPSARLGGLAASALAVASALALGWAAFSTVAPWERALRDSAGTMNDLARLRDEADRARAPSASREDVERFLATLTELRGARPALEPTAIERAIDEVRVATMARAWTTLAGAVERFPAHMPTARAASGLLLQRAFAEPTQARALEREAFDIADRASASARADRSVASGWSATLRVGAADQPGIDAARRSALLREAAEFRSRAIEIDPLGLSHHRALAQILSALGDAQAAAQAARRALVVDGFKRLDPAVRLTESDRRALEALAATP